MTTRNELQLIINDLDGCRQEIDALLGEQQDRLKRFKGKKYIKKRKEIEKVIELLDYAENFLTDCDACLTEAVGMV